MHTSIRPICALALAVAVLVAGSSGAAQTKKKPARSKPAGTGKQPPKSVWPPFETRRADWIKRKQAATDAGTRGPEPLAQYLVDEVVVTGVYDTETGYGVFALARPTGNTFFAVPGAELYNGRLAEIRPAASGFVEDFEIVFVERTGAGKGSADRRVVKRVEPAPGPGSNP